MVFSPSGGDPVLDAMISVAVLSAADPLAASEIARLKEELRKDYYRERRKILAQAIKNAEANGNIDELAAALKDLNELPAAEGEGG